MSKVLITSLSKLSDISILVPIIYSVAKAYPDSRFIVLTQKAHKPLLKKLARNIEPWSYHPENKHKGILGLFRLRKSIQRRKFTHIADMQNEWQTQLLHFRTPFSQNRPQIERIVKGTKEKKKSKAELFKDVLQSLGFDFDITFKSIYGGKEVSYTSLGDWKPETNTRRIGVAPFARHKGKSYPLEKMKIVINKLSDDPCNRIFLFGKGKRERHILNKWAHTFPNTFCTIDKLFNGEELILMSSLDVLISMDSANMHLASLVDTKVVSIWGATQPSLGHCGFNQDLDNAIQVDLPCRPCSIDGDKKCQRGDYACLHNINPEVIVEKIYKITEETIKPQLEADPCIQDHNSESTTYTSAQPK